MIWGLSTAASIWMTAAIGVLIGVGFYGAAVWVTCSRSWRRQPRGAGNCAEHQTTLHLSPVCPHNRVPTSDEIRERMSSHGFAVIDCSFNYCESKQRFQYDLVLQALGVCRSHNLVGELSDAREVVEFRLSPSRA